MEQTGDPSCMSTQRGASLAIDRKIWQQLFDEGSMEDKVRLRSLSNNSALAFLNAPPSDYLQNHFTPQEFRAAICGILGITPHQPFCGLCHADYPDDESHFIHFAHSTGLCGKGGSRIHRHHRLRDMIKFIAKRGNLTVATEVSVDGTSSRPGDVVIDQPGKSIVIDVAVTQPQQKKYREKAATTNAYAAEQYEEDIKVSKFKEKVEQSGQYKFVPFVLEAYGTTSASTQSVITLLARALQTSSAMPYAHAVQWVRQRISSALWRENARSVIERTTPGVAPKSPPRTPAASCRPSPSRPPSAARAPTPSTDPKPMRPAAGTDTPPPPLGCDEHDQPLAMVVLEADTNRHPSASSCPSNTAQTTSDDLNCHKASSSSQLFEETNSTGKGAAVGDEAPMSTTQSQKGLGDRE